MEELYYPLTIGRVGRNRECITTLEDLPCEPRKHILGTDFDEQSRALVMHVPDLVEKFHRLHQVLREQRGNRGRIVGVASADGIGEHRHARLREFEPCQLICQAVAGTLHKRRVECASHWNLLPMQAHRVEDVQCTLDICRGAGDGRLFRRVEVRYPYVWHISER